MPQRFINCGGRAEWSASHHPVLWPHHPGLRVFFKGFSSVPRLEKINFSYIEKQTEKMQNPAFSSVPRLEKTVHKKIRKIQFFEPPYVRKILFFFEHPYVRKVIPCPKTC